jgi:hypothetical protein
MSPKARRIITLVVLASLIAVVVAAALVGT